MNKTVKYRAYVKEFGRTLDVEEIHFVDDSIEVLCDGVEYPISIDGKDNVLQQNTGMIDQEGNFIYEWDILDFGGFDTAIIYYERGGFFAEMHTDKETIISQPLYIFLLKHKNSIIVGNAFENEDLL